MLRVNWTQHIDICQELQIAGMCARFTRDKPTIGAFDTETTGLHIKNDKPFLFQFGWINDETMEGVTYAVDFEENFILAKKAVIQWNALAHNLAIYLGHNIKFDLHMTENIGLRYSGNNVSDTMCWIRLATAAVPTRNGGAPLALKDFAAQYITRDAKNMEQKLKDEKTRRSKEYNESLKKYLGWRKKDIDEFFKDKLHTVDDLPGNKRTAYYNWFDKLPDWLKPRIRGAVDSDDIPYNKLDRNNVIYYAHLDIVWTIETYLRCKEVVENHGNMEAMALENALIQPLVDIENVGLHINRPYLEESEKRLKQYILQRRADLERLAGEPLKCSQSLRIKDLVKEKFGYELEGTGSEVVDIFIADLKHTNPEDPVIEFLETIQELRTLEKWYSTYIVRFEKDTRKQPILYTSMNQAGTVSGRFTSDMQQFPKAGIVDIEGNELFSPRRMIDLHPGYSNMVFIDESGLELRTQACYTILISGGDLNMCRAYMPFKCHQADGTPYTNGDKFEGIEWFRDEDNEPWKPTDLHSATTLNCFPGISEDDEDFHDKRYVGKRVNFASQYGGGIAVFKRMFPQYTDEEIETIGSAYGKTFPDVKKYQNWVMNEARSSAYVENLFGVKYWGADGHHLINMLVQGSGAYFMKMKMLEQYNFLKEHKCKSKMFLQIHDESDYYIAPGEEWIVWELRKIQEKWEGNPIPMVADVEASATNWKEKQEFKTEEEYLEFVTNLC